MSSITWLHLSDIHLRTTDSYNANVVLQSLKKDISARLRQDHLSPDFIVVTGDVASSGQAAEYTMAGQFFDDLLALTGLTKERLFVVPGNHDVDRGAISPLAENASSVLVRRDAVTRFFSEKDDRALVFRRLHNYRDFVVSCLVGSCPATTRTISMSRISLSPANMWAFSP